MAGGDIEHLYGAVVAIQHNGTQGPGHGRHHGSHAVREFHPDGVFRLHRTLAGQHGVAVPDNVGQMRKGFMKSGIAQKARRRGQAGRRTRIEKSRAGRRVAILVALFAEQADDGQVVAQNADAAFRSRAVPGQGGDVARPFADGPEQVKFNGRAKRRGALMGGQGFKNESRIRRSRRLRC